MIGDRPVHIEIDGGVKKSLEIARVLAEVLGPSSVGAAPQADVGTESPEVRQGATAEASPGEDSQEQA